MGDLVSYQDPTLFGLDYWPRLLAWICGPKLPCLGRPDTERGPEAKLCLPKALTSGAIY